MWLFAFLCAKVLFSQDFPSHLILHPDPHLSDSVKASSCYVDSISYMESEVSSYARDGRGVSCYSSKLKRGTTSRAWHCFSVQNLCQNSIVSVGELKQPENFTRAVGGNWCGGGRWERDCSGGLIWQKQMIIETRSFL